MIDYKHIVEQVSRIVRGYHPGVAEQDIQDEIQDALVYVLEGLDKYDPEKGKLDTWLWWRVTGRMSQNRAKRETQRRRMAAAEAPEPRTDELEEIMREVDLQSAMRTVEEVLDKMSERYRDVVKRRLAGETYEDIGTVYGCTRERIRQIETKAMRNLRWQKRPMRILIEWRDEYQ